VRGVYDRHGYLKEKGDALEKLAILVGRILLASETVVPFAPELRRQGGSEGSG